MQGGGQAVGAGMDQLYIDINSGYGNKIGVDGCRFLMMGVAGEVYCDREYK